jgi:cyclopropane-fatty-acyl-phospholipid synthase
MNDRLLRWGIELVERGYIPDALTRSVIRKLCGIRLKEPTKSPSSSEIQKQNAFLQTLRDGPIAHVPEKANEQHYEVPAEFFSTMLGPRRKYSCCFFSHDHASLSEAEDAALSMTCERAEIQDGQDILELGCGWGSLSLWMAQRYPHCRITAVSNSASQRRYIEDAAEAMQIENLHVVTADMNDFHADRHAFDRVVSIEMFEHMRNYQELLRRIQQWIKPDGRLFVHIFCHRHLVYPYETEGSANWMGQYFFTGGIMPSEGLLSNFNESMRVSQQWNWDGTHYQRTADAWLSNLDSQKAEAIKILQATYGPTEGKRWFYRWRMFLLAVSELFGYANGGEWYVTHCLFEPVEAGATAGHTV